MSRAHGAGRGTAHGTACNDLPCRGGETAGQSREKAACKQGRLTDTDQFRPKRITESLIAEAANRHTPRDIVLARLLERYRVLTVDQIAALLFNSTDRARDRLLQLYRMRVVDRARPYDPRVRRPPLHYVLDGVGAALLAAHRRQDTAQALRDQRRRTAANLLASQRLRHTVGTNGVLVALAAHARSTPDARLAAWWSEHDCYRWCGEIVRPDGLGRWQERHEHIEFLLEYDRGTEPTGRIVGKLGGYRALERERGRSSWVLIAVPSPTREDHVRRALAAAGRDLPIATAALGPRPSPQAAVWRPVHAEGPPVRLVELAAIPKPAGALRRAAEGGTRAWRFDQREPKEVIHEYAP